MMSRFKKGKQKGWMTDGEVDAALVDTSTKPWQVLKLFEFKARPADLPKAQFQAQEMCRKLFTCSGGCLETTVGKEKIKLFGHDSFRAYPRGESPDESDLRELAMKVVAIATQPFKPSSMSGLPSSAETQALKVCVTSDPSIIEFAINRLRENLQSKGLSTPQAMALAYTKAAALESIIVVDVEGSLV